MSVDVLDAVDAAVATALGDASVTALAPGGIYNGQVPASATPAGAWIEFDTVAGMDEIRTLRAASGATGRVVPLRYVVRAVCKGFSKAPAKAALAAVDAVLDDATFVLTHGTFLSCRRERFLGDLTDDLVGGVVYQVIPAHYLIEVQV